MKKVIADSAARQEKVRQPEMLLSAKNLQIQEYDDALTARIVEKITVRSRNEIEIRFIGGCQKTMQLTIKIKNAYPIGDNAIFDWVCTFSLLSERGSYEAGRENQAGS